MISERESASLEDRLLFQRARQEAGLKDADWPDFLTVEQFIRLQHPEREVRKERACFRQIVEESIRSGELRIDSLTEKRNVYRSIRRDSQEGFNFNFGDKRVIFGGKHVICGETEAIVQVLSSRSVSAWFGAVGGTPSAYVAAWMKAKALDVTAATGGKSDIPPEKIAPSDHLVIAPNATPDNDFLTRQREIAKRKRDRGKDPGSGRFFVAAVKKESRNRKWNTAWDRIVKSKGGVFGDFTILDVKGNSSQSHEAIEYEHGKKFRKISKITFMQYWSAKEK